MRRALVLLFVTVFLASVVAWHWWLPAAGSSVSVRSVAVSRGDIETTLALTGSVVNDYTVQLTALLDGEITSIEAREGDTVDKSAVLATLDDEPARALLDKAEAERALRQHELDLANRRHARVLQMSRAGDESAQALENSLLEKQRAEAALQLAEADQVLAALRLKNASVRAPFAGIVTLQATETGQWVEAGTRLFTLVAEDGRVVEAEADAGDFSRLAVEQLVSLSLAESPQERWPSQIVRIADSVTTGQGVAGNTFTVRIALGEQAPQLLLGQQLDVDVSTAGRVGVLRVPLEAVQESADGNTHVWIEEQGLARERAVTLGLRTINHAEVTDGLAAGDKVLIGDAGTLSEGVSVVVQSSDMQRQP